MLVRVYLLSVHNNAVLCWVCKPLLFLSVTWCSVLIYEQARHRLDQAGALRNPPAARSPTSRRSWQRARRVPCTSTSPRAVRWPRTCARSNGAGATVPTVLGFGHAHHLTSDGALDVTSGALDVTSGARCLRLGLLRRPLIDRDADLVPGQALRVGGEDVVGVGGGVGVEVLQR